MSYKHAEDIDTSLSGDALKIDALMSAAIIKTADSIDEEKTLSREFHTLTRSILSTFSATHKSIRLLVAQKDSDSRLCSDALSLAREQVEKVFLVSLLADDPDTWIGHYLRDDWKRFYRKYLREKEELQNLPRIAQFLNSETILFLNDLKQRAGITDLEQQAVEFEFYNPGKKLPPELQASFLASFPVGQAVIKRIKNTQTSAFLQRWYREYEELSGYSHVLMEKIALVESAKNLRNESEYKKNKYFQNKVVPSVIASWVSCATACSELYKLTRTNIDCLGALTNYWEELRRGSLLAKLVWDIRAKNFFPPTISGRTQGQHGQIAPGGA